MLSNFIAKILAIPKTILTFVMSKAMQLLTLILADMKTTIDTFIYETTIITPLNSIVEKLQNGEFRDCDIKWLNDRLKKFTMFAMQTLNKKFILEELDYKILNEFVKDRFIYYFTILLKYFKDL